MNRTLKVAVIAGEVSGDLLGGDLIAALKAAHDGPVELVGVGGDALADEGLVSLFDFSELSIMGLTQVLARLPNLIKRINQTASAIVAAKPDVLVIIDSPDFTHRVARKVRAALPDLPIVDYVCPSVWAWKEYRATAMLAYVDHVLAVLPFEPEAMKRLGGPETTFVGHRLTDDPSLLKVRAARIERPVKTKDDEKTILLLPGSRSAEIRALLPVFGEAAREFVDRNGPARFLLPTVPRQEKLVREMAAALPIRPEITTDTESKWAAFAQADAAIAASGTVILELGLSNVPVVSAYKADWLITLMSKRIKIWSGALPNLIADYAVVPEYINEVVRAGSLCRWAERLSFDTAQRRAMMEGFDLTWQRLQVPVPPGEAAAGIVLRLLEERTALSRPAQPRLPMRS
ncbi:lipid-A-disaccharide synthase [Rhizobium puerariae]|uniref:Lipid-A-disaccharide synthase n=1 Tax=Rhizobium puerariae TaxID=1585791 RepID=A0ABV6AMY1_9HYPH